MKIYTKTGDLGETGLLGGSRISKDDPRMDAIGDVDALGATLGWAAVELDDKLMEAVLRIQAHLFELGAELASPKGAWKGRRLLGDSEIHHLESEIDFMNGNLPPLRNFILAGGSEGAARLHICRTFCRKAERSVIYLHKIEPVRTEVLAFLNRLSDWTFMAARYANHLAGVEDVPWIGSEESKND